jgi:hypothetical protein
MLHKIQHIQQQMRNTPEKCCANQRKAWKWSQIIKFELQIPDTIVEQAQIFITAVPESDLNLCFLPYKIR